MQATVADNKSSEAPEEAHVSDNVGSSGGGKDGGAKAVSKSKGKPESL